MPRLSSTKARCPFKATQKGGTGDEETGEGIAGKEDQSNTL